MSLIEELEGLQRALHRKGKPVYRAAERATTGRLHSEETKRKIGKSVKAFAQRRARGHGACPSQVEPLVQTHLVKSA